MRRELGASSALLPDDPPAGAWLPLWLQIRVTDLVIAHHLGGDALALEPLLLEDGARSDDKIVAWVVKKLGPGAVLRRAGSVHPHLYDAGRASSEVHAEEGLVVFEGAAFFENPTWRLLQLFGQRLMLQGMQRSRREAVGVELGAGSFGTRLAWS